MADDLKNKGPQDRSRINMNEAWEVQWWSKKFGVTPVQLSVAVKAVGSSAAAVEKHLADEQ